MASYTRDADPLTVKPHHSTGRLHRRGDQSARVASGSSRPLVNLTVPARRKKLSSCSR